MRQLARQGRAVAAIARGGSKWQDRERERRAKVLAPELRTRAQRRVPLNRRAASHGT